MINIQKMMQQAQEMQNKLQEMQEKFKDIHVSGEAGGGMVKATMTCTGDLIGLDIDPNVISADDKETLEDLVKAAVNNASKARESRVQQETSKMMQQLGLPEGALGKLPFGS